MAEIFDLCMDVITREKELLNLDQPMYPYYASKLSPRFYLAFNRPYSRVSFMYRYATCYISFFQDRIKEFLSVCPKAQDLLASWRSRSDHVLCSLSCGPGLDYLAFSLAVLQFGETLNPLRSVKIISKNGAWRSTVSLLPKSIKKCKKSLKLPKQLNFQNAKVIKGDIFEKFTEKMIHTLQNCDVLFMFKTLNLLPNSDAKPNTYRSALKVLMTALKPETTIFFIDTKRSARLMLTTLEEFPGTFLYDPYFFPHNKVLRFDKAKFRAKFGRCPATSTQGVFFVWQKSSLISDVTFTPENIRLKSLVKEDVKKFAATEFSFSDSLSKEWYTIENLSKASSSMSMTPNGNSNISQIGCTKFVSDSPPAPEECFCHKYLSKQSTSTPSSSDDEALIVKIAPCHSFRQTPNVDKSSQAKSLVSGSRYFDQRLGDAPCNSFRQTPNADKSSKAKSLVSGSRYFHQRLGDDDDVKIAPSNSFRETPNADKSSKAKSLFSRSRYFDQRIGDADDDSAEVRMNSVPSNFLSSNIRAYDTANNGNAETFVRDRTSQSLIFSDRKSSKQQKVIQKAANDSTNLRKNSVFFDIPSSNIRVDDAAGNKNVETCVSDQTSQNLVFSAEKSSDQQKVKQNSCDAAIAPMWFRKNFDRFNFPFSNIRGDDAASNENVETCVSEPTLQSLIFSDGKSLHQQKLIQIAANDFTEDRNNSAPINVLQYSFSINPSFNIPICVSEDSKKVGTCVNDQTLQSLISSDKKSSKQQKVIQNVIGERHTSDLSGFESKSTQTDCFTETFSNYPDSMNLLTGSIKRPACSITKEPSQRKKLCTNHEMHFDRCQECHYTSHSKNCDNTAAKNSNCVYGNSESEIAEVDSLLHRQPVNESNFSECSKSSVACCRGCCARGCHSRPDEIQCGQRQPSSLEPLFVNGLVNVTEPSIILPLKNINQNALSKILSHVNSY